MAGIIINLIETIKEQISLYEILLESTKEKKRAVIENNIDLINKLNDDDNITVGRIMKLDKKREELFRDIAFVLNKEMKGITITKIIEYIKGQPEEEEVTRLKEKMTSLLSEINDLNEKNKKLIGYAIEQIDFSMNLVRSTLSNEPSYYDTMGNEILSDNKRLFDAKQ